MSKSQQFLEQEGRYGVSGEVCFHFPLDTDDFFIDVISWIVLFGGGSNRRSTKSHELTRTVERRNTKDRRPNTKRQVTY
jgi:hypothetical protein